MSLDSGLSGRVALVTGGSRGIGKAVALALAREGVKVAVNFNKSGREADAVVTSIERAGGRAIAFGADVSSASAVQTMIAKIAAEWGGTDLLVNNAGIAIRHDLDDLTEADFDRTIAVNLKSAFLCTQAVVSWMRERRWGRIINISSGAARGAGLVESITTRRRRAWKGSLAGMQRGWPPMASP